MRCFSPKSAVEQLAQIELRERQIEDKIPDYMQQIRFAFKEIAKTSPGANVMSLDAIARSIDCDPETASEILKVLVRKKQLERTTMVNGKTGYLLAESISRPRLFRL